MQCFNIAACFVNVAVFTGTIEAVYSVNFTAYNMYSIVHYVWKGFSQVAIVAAK